MPSPSRRVFSLGNLRQLLSGHIPGQVIIQLTDRCNAHCPQCEMRVGNRFSRASIEDEAIRLTLDAAAARGVAAVSFTGGEPLLELDRLVRWLAYARDLGIPYLRTGTNGYFLRHHEQPGFDDKVEEIASRLAATGLRNLWISLDSADPATHEHMRGLPGVVEGMARALPIFERHGLWPTANLGLNRATGGGTLALAAGAGEAERQDFYGSCLEAFRAFYRQVLRLGFTVVNCCYPMSVESEPEAGLLAVYRASSADDVVNFRRDEKALLFAALSQAVAEFRSRLRVFTPRSTLHTLVGQYAAGEEDPYPCHGGVDFFFVAAADGHAYPCGFRSTENLGPYWQLPASRELPAPSCRSCDWECFRDPSHLAGPVMELASRPWQLARRFWTEPEWRRLWRGDLAYLAAADHCDGRRPPDPDRLARFAPAPTHIDPSQPLVASTQGDGA